MSGECGKRPGMSGSGVWRTKTGRTVPRLRRHVSRVRPAWTRIGRGQPETVGAGRTWPDTREPLPVGRTGALTCTFGALVLAEGVGFEPTRSMLLAVFKTAAIGH